MGRGGSTKNEVQAVINEILSFYEIIVQNLQQPNVKPRKVAKTVLEEAEENDDAL